MTVNDDDALIGLRNLLMVAAGDPEDDDLEDVTMTMKKLAPRTRSQPKSESRPMTTETRRRPRRCRTNAGNRRHQGGLLSPSPRITSMAQASSVGESRDR
jgi:hypothetical protein